jgi:hypothetical protein
MHPRAAVLVPRSEDMKTPQQQQGHRCGSYYYCYYYDDDHLSSMFTIIYLLTIDDYELLSV